MTATKILVAAAGLDPVRSIRTLCVLAVAVTAASCVHASADGYEDEYLPYVQTCQEAESPGPCGQAALVAEFHAREADKAGNEGAAQRAWQRAADAADRACKLGDDNGCELAKRYHEKL